MDNIPIYIIGDMAWCPLTDLEIQQREAMLMYLSDLAAHREWLKSQRVDREAERRRAFAAYDAEAERTRAAGMCML